MTELTSREMLDAIDRALEMVSRRFAGEATKPVGGPDSRVSGDNSNNADHQVMPMRRN